MRRKTLLLPALAVVFIGGAWWWVHGPPEPVYKGDHLGDLMWAAWNAPELVKAVTNAEAVAAAKATVPKSVRWLAWTMEHGQEHQPDQSNAPPPSKGAELLQKWRRKLFPRRYPTRYNERLQALIILRQLGRDAAPAIPVLERMFWGDYGCGAAHAILNCGAAGQPAIERCFDRDPGYRKCFINACMGALRRGSPFTDAEVDWIEDLLLKALGHSEKGTRYYAAVVLSGFGEEVRRPPPDAALPVLLEGLSDPGTTFRNAAVLVLGSHGRKAASAIPDLIPLLDSPDSYLRIGAAGSLGRIDGAEKRSLERLRQLLLNDPQADVRAAAKKAIEILEADLAP